MHHKRQLVFYVRKAQILVKAFRYLNVFEASDKDLETSGWTNINDIYDITWVYVQKKNWTIAVICWFWACRWISEVQHTTYLALLYQSQK